MDLLSDFGKLNKMGGDIEIRAHVQVTPPDSQEQPTTNASGAGMAILPIDEKSQNSNGVALPNGFVGEKGHEMNGSASENKSTDKLAAWHSVSKWLPSRGSDSDYWWNLTGPHLAMLLACADYSIAYQFEILLFYWRLVVPVLGPAATSGRKGVSGTTQDGTRIEYSWRWSEDNKPPEIRTAFDPFSPEIHTLRDPLGLTGVMDLFHDVAPYSDDVDLEFIYKFLDYMYDRPHQMYMKSDAVAYANHMGIGIEFGQKSFVPKAYFRPRKTFQEDKTGSLSIDDWQKLVTEAFGQMSVVENVFDFIRNKQSNFGLCLQPMYIGADVVSSPHRRLKLYCTEKKTSFNSVCSVLTMGGTIKLPQTALDGMWELIRGLCGLPDDFSRDEELPKSAPLPDQTGGYDKSNFWRYFGYYFEMGAARDVPDIKVYIPTTHYGVNDQVVAEQTTQWMEKNGRGKYVPAFWEALHSISTHRRLDEGLGVMLWLALMVKKGSLQVTTYLAPEGYHPKRFEEMQQ